MTHRRLEIDPDAAMEAVSAYRWYADRSKSAAERFLDDLDTTFTKIMAAPERWPTLGARIRRCLLKSFPYMVIYAVSTDRILVLAVAHGRRKPGYWRSRLKP